MYKTLATHSRVSRECELALIQCAAVWGIRLLDSLHKNTLLRAKLASLAKHRGTDIATEKLANQDVKSFLEQVQSWLIEGAQTIASQFPGEMTVSDAKSGLKEKLRSVSVNFNGSAGSTDGWFAFDVVRRCVLGNSDAPKAPLPRQMMPITMEDSPRRMMSIVNVTDMEKQLRDCESLSDWRGATQLVVLPTMGDGSCALHAAEGTWSESHKRVFVQSVQDFRVAFAKKFESAMEHPDQRPEVNSMYRAIVLELLTSDAAIESELSGKFRDVCLSLRQGYQQICDAWDIDRLSTLKKRVNDHLSENDGEQLAMVLSLDSTLTPGKLEEDFDRVARVLVSNEHNLPTVLRQELQDYLKNSEDRTRFESQIGFDDVVFAYANQLTNSRYELSPAEVALYACLMGRPCLMFSCTDEGLRLEMAAEGAGSVIAMAHNGYRHYEQVRLPDHKAMVKTELLDFEVRLEAVDAEVQGTWLKALLVRLLSSIETDLSCLELWCDVAGRLTQYNIPVVLDVEGFRTSLAHVDSDGLRQVLFSTQPDQTSLEERLMAFAKQHPGLTSGFGISGRETHQNLTTPPPPPPPSSPALLILPLPSPPPFPTEDF